MFFYLHFLQIAQGAGQAWPALKLLPYVESVQSQHQLLGAATHDKPEPVPPFLAGGWGTKGAT